MISKISYEETPDYNKIKKLFTEALNKCEISDDGVSVYLPTTQVPTTHVPTTQVPTTQVPTTQVPTTQVPTTQVYKYF